MNRIFSKFCFFAFPVLLAVGFGYESARAQSPNPPQDPPATAIPTVPDEFFVGEVPGVGPLHGARASWFFWRPPFLWVQGQLINAGQMTLPQWDKNQIPLSISPTIGANKVSLILESGDGGVIDELPLTVPFTPDRYLPTKGTPTHYRVRVAHPSGRLILTTRRYPWLQRQKVFECDVDVERGEDPLKLPRVRTCLATLEALPKNADRQWYATVQWPETRDAIKRNAGSSRDRELRATFRKAGHVYESERKGRKFLVKAGVTGVESVPVLESDFATVPKTQAITESATREERRKTLFSAETAGQGRVEIVSFASDEVEQSAQRSPEGPNPRINLQIIPGSGTGPILRGTEFLESRTGMTGVLRRWQGRSFINYNQLTSSRGEKNSMMGGPGLDLSYASNLWDLEPFFLYDSGVLHLDSDIFVTEFQIGARRGFSFLPRWISFYSAFHQYQLAGQNPGTSRLGANDAIAVGFRGQVRSGSHVVTGRMAMLASTGSGFDSQLEYAKVWHRDSDFHLTLGIFLGLSRYAGSVIIPTNGTVQNLSEDRFVIGFSLGFLGPESTSSGRDNEASGAKE